MVDTVDHLSRERRKAELRELQSSDPRGLIEKYCEITGEPTSSQLPHGVSFSRMIDTIVDHELKSRLSRQNRLRRVPPLRRPALSLMRFVGE